jgi:Fe-S cluster assembly iron-binding protein IscA
MQPMNSRGTKRKATEAIRENTVDPPPVIVATVEAPVVAPPPTRTKAQKTAALKSFEVIIGDFQTKTKSATHGRAAARGFSQYLSNTKQRNMDLRVEVHTKGENGTQHHYQATQVVLETPLEIKRGNSTIRCKCKTKVTAMKSNPVLSGPPTPEAEAEEEAL